MKGIIASAGIAIGKVLLFEKQALDICTDLIEVCNVKKEIDRYTQSVHTSGEQLKKLAAHTQISLGEDKAAIFNAHLDLLCDPALEESVLDKIQNRRFNAEYALEASAKEICEIFECLDDPYLKERAADVRDVCSRLMHNMKGIEIRSLDILHEACIVVAKDLTPSDTASMDLSKVLGFATDIGGATSHTAIMAKSLEIPAVVGLKSISSSVKSGDFIILDAINGEIILNPSSEDIACYESKRKEYLSHKKSLDAYKELPAITSDGKRVELCANIGNVSDLDSAVKNGAEGIGLFRTEFLYMDNVHFPTEEEQFNAYFEAARRMNGKPVIIRTLDIGGDKELPYFSFPEEQNPFLGWRAIRMCLDNRDIFKVQLRAILRASTLGNIMVMFPMITSLGELKGAKELLNQCKTELSSEGKSFDAELKIGIMVETPAAVILADKFAAEVDFFSIGTNDLTQYTLAVDRGNEKISQLYNPFHPAVLNSIKKVIDASHRANKWTGMCGELAGNKKAVLLLLGMGLDEFSMSASSLLEVKQLIRNLSYSEMQKVAAAALDMGTSDEVEEYLDKIY